MQLRATDGPAQTPVTSAGLDRVVVALVIALMTIGVVMVYSASVPLEGPLISWQRWWSTPLRQAIYAVAGVVAMFVVATAGYRWLSWPATRGWVPLAILSTCTALLIAALLPALSGRELGLQRAIVLLRRPFVLSFQPFEVAKVGLVVFLSAALARLGPRLCDLWRGYLPTVAACGVLIALTGLEDLGTAALMVVVAAILLYLGRARWRHLLCTALLGLAGLTALVAHKPYRVQRIVTFLTEDPDPAGAGYQIRQALLAIGSGGWLGRGLGNSVQKYGYLPQDNNDFVFAILCEELGLAGGLVVIGLYLALLARGAWIACRCPDPFGQLLAWGITLLITLQAAFNIAVVTHAVPTKGISLPFVSSGGSGVLILGAAAGLLAAVGGAVRTRRLDEPDATLSAANHPDNASSRRPTIQPAIRT